MLTLMRLRIIFSTVAESPSVCRSSNSSVKLCPKWTTPHTRPFFPASIASEIFSKGTFKKHENVINESALPANEVYLYLNDILVDVSKIATTQHRIRTVCRIIADLALSRIHFVINDGHFEILRFVSKSHIKNGGLEGGQQVDE